MVVDFYVLKEDSYLKCLHFICELIEKAYQQKQTVYVHTASLTEAERLDNLLWTYKDSSFIPHAIHPSASHESPAVCIGYDINNSLPYELLINLSTTIPPFYTHHKHIIEIVFNDPVMQQLARERFKQYREQQCEINTIKNSS